ncbi:hypothetical protein BKA63DRAFT_124105 [Paraphoma chrysanthemicola]|nr:hypothetical protein BKA63DRAFT_124105 [Paraphoma chrysanthemicola]
MWAFGVGQGMTLTVLQPVVWADVPHRATPKFPTWSRCAATAYASSLCLWFGSAKNQFSTSKCFWYFGTLPSTPPTWPSLVRTQTANCYNRSIRTGLRTFSCFRILLSQKCPDCLAQPFMRS